MEESVPGAVARGAAPTGASSQAASSQPGPPQSGPPQPESPQSGPSQSRASVPQPPVPATSARRGRLTRRRHGAVIAGVATGLADQTGWDVRVVRVLFVVSNLAFGLGLVSYLALWILAPEQGRAGERQSVRRLPVQLLLVGVALVALGALGVTGHTILPDMLRPLLPVVAVALGAVIAWRDVEAFERQSWLGPGGGRRTLPRVLAGAALAGGGLVILITSDQGLSMAWDVGVATVAVLAGIGLVLAPWVAGFWRRYEREQTARIRETERADIAAHLHDSVLQTLALIQRTDDPAVATRLARAQERELRTWLYGGAPTAGSLAEAVAAAAHEVEDRHGVPVELVVTGDTALDDTSEALVRALREALTNAVRHARPPVTAYVEIGGGVAEAFVRDHGDGFDLDDIAPDRLGVRESILGRMERHGGSARVRRLDEGTEICLRLPLEPADPPDTSEPAGPGHDSAAATATDHSAAATAADHSAAAVATDDAAVTTATDDSAAATAADRRPAALPRSAATPSTDLEEHL